MQLSFSTFTLAFLSLVAGRELSIVRRDGNHVVVKSKGNTNYLWFSMSVEDGVPQFIIKGSQKDDESSAKANVQLRMENVHEAGSVGYPLQGTQPYWSEIGMEEVPSSDSKCPKQMILRSRMVHQDQDIAGNYFSFILEAIVDENAHEFSIRPMIQNFPYARVDGKGKLDLTQMFMSSRSAGPKLAMGKGSFSSPFGSLQVNENSAIEDGNPGVIAPPQTRKEKQKKGMRAMEVSESSNMAEIEFQTTRPKNATFEERLVFNMDSIKLPIAGLEKDEAKDKMKGMTINVGTRSICNMMELTAILGLIGLLFLTF